MIVLLAPLNDTSWDAQLVPSDDILYEWYSIVAPPDLRDTIPLIVILPIPAVNVNDDGASGTDVIY